MSKSSFEVCDISPVRPNKVDTTPRRPRSKASRSDRGIDVHTICSTPQSHGDRFMRGGVDSPKGRFSNSPSSSFPYSQENCPDVVWDFSSPKLPQGAKKKELKLTIQELLENLNKYQVPESGNQPAPYVKLLENWMSNQTVKTTEKKKQKTPCKKENKKRSRQVLDELRKFIETMAGAKKEAASASTSRQNDPNTSQTKDRSTKLNISAEAFIDGESTENDSMDELWGENDNSFIVKATQELEFISANTNQNLDVVSTIPETDPSLTNVKPNQNNNSAAIDMEKYSDLLEHLSNVDWDSDIDTDDWDNGFLVEDDALSAIPDEVLSGTVQEDLGTHELVATDKSASLKKIVETDSGVGSVENTVNLNSQSGNLRQPVSSAELFNSFEDDSFEDESLFFQPEVLSQIDEVENMLSQAPKCTPEEIEKKKDEALKRRLRSRGPKKS